MVRKINKMKRSLCLKKEILNEHQYYFVYFSFNHLISNVLNYFIDKFMGCCNGATKGVHNQYKDDTKSKLGNITQKPREFPRPNLIQQGVEQIQIYGEKLYKLQLSEMKMYPYCSIGAITARDKSGYLIKASGALISNYFVLSAAHVIFNRKQGPLYKSSISEEDQKYGASYKNIRFYPAAYDILQEQKGFQVECWRYPLQYPDLKCNNFQAYDYAILKLKDSVPRPVGGFLSPSAYSHQMILQENSSKELQIFGYPYKQNLSNYDPINKDDNAFRIFQYGLKKSQRIKKISKENGIIYYQISTIQGQSGCPIVFGEDYIGIHTRGFPSQQLNGGNLFTQQILAKITEWQKQIKSYTKEKRKQKSSTYVNQKQKKQLEQHNDPKDAYDYKNRGDTYKDLKDYHKALADYTTAIQIEPKYTDAYFNRGITYYELKDYHKALADYTTAIQIDPYDANAYNNRGMTYYELKDYEKALADYNAALKIDPKYTKAYSNRGLTYYNLKDYHKALADCNTAIQIDPKLTIAYNNRGNTYYNLKDYDKALADYNTTIQIDPKYAMAYHNRGLIYYNLKDYHRSLADYNTAIQIDPQYTNAYFNRGNSYKYLNDHYKALADYTTVIQIDPNHAFAYHNRGFIHKDLKDYHKALADFTTSFQIDPKYADAYNSRGITYQHLKDYKKALSDFQSALSLSPNNPLYLIQIAICCDELGEAKLLVETLAKCEQSLSSKHFSQIQTDFGISESAIVFIRSNLSRLKAKAKANK